MRKTTLPDLPSKHESRGLAAFAAAFKAELADVEATMKRHWLGLMEPDPWDEAVKWIEQHEAAKAEWPWPARS